MFIVLTIFFRKFSLIIAHRCISDKNITFFFFQLSGMFFIFIFSCFTTILLALYTQYKANDIENIIDSIHNSFRLGIM